MWSLIDWHLILLSLIVFSVITGMNCKPYKDEDICDVDHTEFWIEIGVSRAYCRNLIDLRLVLEICTYWSLEKRTWFDCYAFFILPSMEWLSHVEFLWTVRRRYLIWKLSRDIWFGTFPEIYVGSCIVLEFDIGVWHTMLCVPFTAPTNLIQWKSSFLSYRYEHMSQLRA